MRARRPGGGILAPVRRTIAVLSLLALSAVALSGCNRGDDPTVTTDDTAGTSTSSSTPPDETTTSTSFTATSLPATAPATTTRGYLAEIRVASHDGFDRVVFEFEDALPGYRVAMTTRPVTEDGSGDTVEVKGDALLEVRFENAAMARIEGEKVVPVYEGPRRVTTKGDLVQELVDAGDFEGVVTWVVGLDDDPAAVRVSTLTAPFRLVIDVATKR